MISSLANLYVMVRTDQNKRRKKDCLKRITRLRKLNGDWAADAGGPEASLPCHIYAPQMLSDDFDDTYSFTGRLDNRP